MAAATDLPIMCYNNPPVYRVDITPEMFEVWMNLLKRIDKACLCLIDDNPITVRNLKTAVAAADVDPARVIFLPRTDHPTFCARLRHFDVFLDTYPYNCGSTTSDVVNAGVPLVTRYGRTMVSRMGRSMLSALGLQELIANSFSEYVDITLKIANDADYQKELVKSVKSSMLRKQKNPKLLTTSLENQIQLFIQKKS